MSRNDFALVFRTCFIGASWAFCSLSIAQDVAYRVVGTARNYWSNEVLYSYSVVMVPGRSISWHERREDSDSGNHNGSDWWIDWHYDFDHIVTCAESGMVIDTTTETASTGIGFPRPGDILAHTAVSVVIEPLVACPGVPLTTYTSARSICNATGQGLTRATGEYRWQGDWIIHSAIPITDVTHTIDGVATAHDPIEIDGNVYYRCSWHSWFIPYTYSYVGGIQEDRFSNTPLWELWKNTTSFALNPQRVPLEGVVSLSNSSVVPTEPAVLSVRTSSSQTVRFDTPVQLSQSGSFSLPVALVSNSYDFAIKHSHWLRKRVHSATVTSGGISGLSFDLVNGDCDRDNEIGPGDFGLLSAGFGSENGGINWLPDADLDGDGEIGPSDFGILSANFGLQGD